jgi:HD-like signal output (HDOD) protein
MATQSTDLLDVRALEAAAHGLAPLPASTSRLLAMANDPDVRISAVVEIAQYDPGLTAALLRQANSADACGTRQITDVRDAIVRLGLGAVATIAMRSSIKAALDGPLDLYEMQSGELYRHAVMSAVSAEVLRARCPNRVPALTPTVALLHDIGKLVIAQALGTRTVELVSALSTTDGQGIHESELAVFGLHHGHAGAYVIQHWKLPTSFLDAIVNHHGGQDEPSYTSLACQLSDRLAHVIDAPSAQEEAVRTAELGPLCEPFGIGPDEVPSIVELTGARYDEVQTLIEG